MNNDIVAVIPVKASSERVKNKNMRPFHDTTLFELKLKQLENVKGFSSIVVSSESPEILQIAKKYGCTLHQRDPYYSTSDVPMSDKTCYQH